MELEKVKVGVRVKTSGQLGKTTGILVAPKNLDARQPNKEGVVDGYVPGHGGDVWWIRHADGTAGAYMFDEFEPVT